MLKITYTSATTREAFDLSCAELFAAEPSDFRAVEWDYAVGYRDVTHAARKARKASIDMAALDLTRADAFRRAADADMAAMAPGSVEADGWSQRCYVAGVEAKFHHGGAAVLSLTLLLLDGVWRKASSWEFLPSSGSGEVGEAHGYPYGYGYGYPYGYGGSREIEVAGAASSPVRLTVYGPATSPSVTIGENRYQVDVDVPDGAHLTVDGVAGTVVMTAKNGYATNCLGDAVLGGGERSGSYIFERVPAGASSVAYSGAFGFDLDVYREEGAVPWTSS